MTDLLKIVVVLFLGIIAVMIVSKIVMGLLSMVLPILVIGGVAYVIYRIASPKSISGGRGIIR